MPFMQSCHLCANSRAKLKQTNTSEPVYIFHILWVQGFECGHLGSAAGLAGVSPQRIMAPRPQPDWWHMMLTASLKSQCILVTLSPLPLCSFNLATHSHRQLDIKTCSIFQ